MIIRRVIELALQRITTYRMRGMRSPHEVGVELGQLSTIPDLTLEHKVKIGVQKGWQLLYSSSQFDAAEKTMEKIQPVAVRNWMTRGP